MKASPLVLFAVITGVAALSNEISSNVSQSILKKKDKEICMKELGCFAITSDFRHLLYRPINVLPHDRSVIDTKFLLYTRKNPKEADRLWAHDKESITESHLDVANPTKFIVHGFMDSEIFGPWMEKLKQEFLMNGDYNMIIIDWSGGNKPPYYQASSNTRVVGAEVAQLILALEKFVGIKPEDCHVIGHSLGAHVAGYAGERLNKRLGRITGCDPAEPYFQNLPPSVRLDPTDADYIDVIHSDATTILLGGFGMSQMVGHADFFPNNGRKQPGCYAGKVTSFITDGLNEGTRRFTACNHQRSLDFMEFSINFKKVVPVAYECSDWKSFLEGKCAECGSDGSKCAIMGLRADEYKPHRKENITRAFYLKTGGSTPFWLYHYQITIKLYKPRTKFEDQKGAFEVTLHGSKTDYSSSLDNDDINLYHGSQYRYLMTTDKELGEITSATLKWYSSSKNPLKLIFKPKIYIEFISVLLMNEVEFSPRNMTGRTFCGSPTQAIPPRQVMSFTRGSKCSTA